MWLAGLLLTVASGCSEAQPKPIQKPAGPQFSKSTQDGRFVVEVDSVPRPMPTNDHFSMTIDILAKDKATDLGAIEIEVDADMPEHKHGMNTRPIVKKSAPGKFVAEGMLLHMPGRWEIYVVLKDDKNWTERLMFEHIAD